METENQSSGILSKINEALADQVWYQQLKSKWEELDPKSRMYLGLASVGAIVLALLITVVSAYISVRSLRTEYAEKADLLQKIQAANDEIRQLRETTGGTQMADSADPNAPWPDYFKAKASAAGIDANTLAVNNEKAAPGGEGSAKETLFEIQLNKVNIRQLTRYSFQLEHGGRPVKLRNLKVDAQDDGSGWLNATLAVSAFSPAQ